MNAEAGERRLDRICAFDIAEDGSATQVTEAWPSVTGEARYRWLHLDLAGEDVAEWTAREMGALAAATLLAPQTRPRCVAINGGLALNLRGVNLNEGKDEEDMVSVRVWANERSVVSIRIQTVFAVRDVRESAEANEAPVSPGHWIAALAERLTARIEEETVALGDAVEAMEDEAELGVQGLSDRLTRLRRKAAKMRRSFILNATRSPSWQSPVRNRSLPTSSPNLRKRRSALLAHSKNSMRPANA